MNSLLIWLRISLLISQKARHRSINNNGGDLMAADFNSCQYLSRKCGPLEYTVHGRKTTLKFRHVYVDISDLSQRSIPLLWYFVERSECALKSLYSILMIWHNHLDFLFAPPSLLYSYFILKSNWNIFTSFYLCACTCRVYYLYMALKSEIRMGLSGKQFTNQKLSVQPKVPRVFVHSCMWTLKIFFKERNTFPFLGLIQYWIQNTFNTF